ncbi:hypothetical protein LPW26_14625 [Rhodopseudomonas sp. HC1]|uniref:hypothetical protein n=1 Tax=Rhodopseudomonas infernalis TaxID=2897386 RepID=UPI001EE98811|nr:hypothetical protein [Rhodopseudomonas infernalis]MCG6205883.1 hypothetical protein [Rhodopseudomonas infernalis]
MHIVALAQLPMHLISIAVTSLKPIHSAMLRLSLLPLVFSLCNGFLQRRGSKP